MLTTFDDALNRAMDALIEEPEAFYVYKLFIRSGSCILSMEVDVHPKTPSWTLEQYQRAINVLIRRGFISEIMNPFDGRPTGLFRYRDTLRAVDLCVKPVGACWHVVDADRPEDLPHAICKTNAAALLWIDHNTDTGQNDEGRHYRIRNSGPSPARNRA